MQYQNKNILFLERLLVLNTITKNKFCYLNTIELNNNNKYT